MKSPKLQPNRQVFLLAGAALLLVGGQLRAVESFVLRPETTRVLANYQSAPPGVAPMRQMILDNTSPRKTLTPPSWIGWACLTAGIVLTAHGFLSGVAAGKRPGS